MTTRVVILGAGAAGTAAARVLSTSEANVEVTLVACTDETPSNRTLVNKAVAIGLLQPEQAALPGVTAQADTAVRIDADASRVDLASGATLDYDALIVATGSAPRTLDATIPGVAAATEAGLLTTLHSIDDAVRVRDLLAGRDGAHVVILGAGMVAAETASLLHERGHDVVMIARADVPGASAFGPDVAARLTALHRRTVTTRFGRSVRSLAPDADGLLVTLDDSTTLPADLVIVGHGTTPTAPAPYADGVRVDERLRGPLPGTYAAGGVAIHGTWGTDHGPWRIDHSPWRIDHWADAAAQGEHAARTVLHDLFAAADPGPYLPRSPYTATVHGAVVAAVGRADADGTVVSSEPLVVAHSDDGVVHGVSGVDAVPAVFGWMSRLHQSAADSPS
ncbi:MAG: NAD(P)/FAD-dependent oxidoreductase [Microbacterium sp.]